MVFHEDMTKEMRPSHRIDVLTDALLHFARLIVVSLSKDIVSLVDTVCNCALNGYG